MHAEQLIALEAAMADLSQLYTTARLFRPLADQAETVLLPRITALGRQLRSLARAHQLDDVALQPIADEMLGLATDWNSAVSAIRDSAPCGSARMALELDRQDDLARCLPEIFAGLEPVTAPSELYFPFHPAAARRRPGQSPFLAPHECAARLADIVRDGLPAEEHGSEWWEVDFPYLEAAGSPAALATPIWLCAASATIATTVFATADKTTYRLYTSRLHLPLRVGVEAQATDEWWQAYESSYDEFRTALLAALAARGVPLVNDRR